MHAGTSHPPAQRKVASADAPHAHTLVQPCGSEAAFMNKCAAEVQIHTKESNSNPKLVSSHDTIGAAPNSAATAAGSNTSASSNMLQGAARHLAQHADMLVTGPLLPAGESILGLNGAGESLLAKRVTEQKREGVRAIRGSHGTSKIAGILSTGPMLPAGESILGLQGILEMKSNEKGREENEGKCGEKCGRKGGEEEGGDDGRETEVQVQGNGEGAGGANSEEDEVQAVRIYL